MSYKQLMNRVFCLILLQFSIYSCKDLVAKKLDLGQLKSERLSEVQWDDIDGLPMPPGCDDTENVKDFSPCFLKFMSGALGADQQLLERLRIELGDTLHLNLDVDPYGGVQLRFQSVQDNVAPTTPGLLAELESLLAAESWVPGTKRGVPVRVKFDYDLVLLEAK